MLRSEAMNVAEQLTPEGFKFNSLELHRDSSTWITTFINTEIDPPQVIIERWPDVYTDLDPEPENDASDEETRTDPETVGQTPEPTE